MSVINPEKESLLEFGKLPSSKYGIISLFVFWRKVFNFIEGNKEDIDIYVLHNPMYPFFQNKQGKSIISTIHTTYYGNFKFNIKQKNLFNSIYYGVAKLFEKSVLKKMFDYGKVVAIDHTIKKEVSEIVSNKDIKIINNGVNFSDLNNSKFLERDNNMTRKNEILKVLYVGRFTEQKNPMKTIKIFEKILNFNDIELELNMVGRGKLIEKCEKYIENKKIDKINILGYVSETKLSELRENSDFYILLSDYEGQPVSFIESLYYGQIPIISKIPQLEYMMKDLDEDYYYSMDINSEEDIIGLVKYIKKIKMNNINDYRINISNYCQNKFSSVMMVDNYIRLFNQN